MGHDSVGDWESDGLDASSFGRFSGKRLWREGFVLTVRAVYGVAKDINIGGVPGGKNREQLGRQGSAARPFLAAGEGAVSAVGRKVSARAFCLSRWPWNEAAS